MRRIFACLLMLFCLSACTVLNADADQAALNVQAEPFSLKLGQQTPSPAEPTPHPDDVFTAEEQHEFLLIEEFIIGLLFVAVLTGIAAHRLRVPYTVGLVFIGLALTLVGQMELRISPQLILALLVPPLLFEAAFHINFNDLRDNLTPILALAVPGVLLTTAVVGAIVAWGAGLSLPTALVFGALVSATDPVSVVALFRSMGVPKRLLVLLEGESLFNDGTAIVVFNLMVTMAAGVAVTGETGLLPASLDWFTTILTFIWVSGGGLLVGFLLGMGISSIIARIDDYLIETTLTSVLAYGAYLIGEALGVSGVLAVVAAGLVNGNIGPRGMSPTTRIVVYNFWEYAAFLANTFIFLLIGLRIELPLLFEHWHLIAWAVAGVLVARALGVYSLSRLGGKVPLAWQHVLNWGGLRGAISLALALSLPGVLPEASSQIQVMAFGVVLFTLLVQGFTMKPLVNRLGLVERNDMQIEYERRHARAVAGRAAYAHLERRHRQGLLSDYAWQLISPLLTAYNRSLAGAVREIMFADPRVEAEELDTAHREALRAQRSTINSLLKDHVIGEDIHDQLIADIDAALSQPQAGWSELLGSQNRQDTSINRLMAAVIQEHDLENALSALAKISVAVTRVESSGAFFGRRNATLLLGVSDRQVEGVVKALARSCQHRVEYLSGPVPGFPPGISEPIEVTVGGATIFTFEVERYETF